MSNPSVQRSPIGSYKSVEIELVTWDASMAEVALSCACLFTHEINQKQPVGGLLHLNAAMDGLLFSLRDQKAFSGNYLDTLLIDQNLGKIKAERLLIVGLGRPEDWSGQTSADAVSVAAKLAYQLHLESVAIAPSVLDTGIEPNADFSLQMLAALKERIDRQEQYHQLGLVKAPSIKKWVFDAGYTDFDAKADKFRENFQKLMNHYQ